MKALSLLQPWASLVAIGAKQWETRSWETPFRGEVAIHASKGYGPGGKAAFYDICSVSPYKQTLIEGCRLPAHKTAMDVMKGLPLGSIVAVSEIVVCMSSVEWTRRYWNQAWNFPHADKDAKAREFDFGNYEPNRFAWKLQSLRRLAQPVPVKGMLGLWEVPADVEAKVRAQLP